MIVFNNLGTDLIGDAMHLLCDDHTILVLKGCYNHTTKVKKILQIFENKFACNRFIHTYMYANFNRNIISFFSRILFGNNMHWDCWEQTCIDTKISFYMTSCVILIQYHTCKLMWLHSKPLMYKVQSYSRRKRPCVIWTVSRCYVCNGKLMCIVFKEMRLICNIKLASRCDYIYMNVIVFYIYMIQCSSRRIRMFRNSLIWYTWSTESEK